jgi:hypothetical protein
MVFKYFKNKGNSINKYDIMKSALDNEAYIDYITRTKFFPKRMIGFNVPRPAIILQIFKKDWTLIPLLYIGSLTWFFFYVPFIVYKILKFYKILMNRKTTSREITSDKIFILSSHRVLDLCDFVYDKNKPSDILVLPWLKVGEKLNNTSLKLIEFENFLTFKDLGWAAYYSLIGLIKWGIYTKASNVIQTYVLYEFFLMYIVLIKLNKLGVKKYWYSNHYDRWSVLLDNIVINKNTMIQHGFMWPEASYPTKLINIEKIFVLDKESISIFKNLIVKNDSNVIYEIQGLSWQLDENINYNDSILIISHLPELENEIELIKLVIINLPDVKIFIKPHPMDPKGPYLKAFHNQSNVTIILKNRFYPRVKVAINRYSTLGMEYQQRGIDVIWVNNLSLETVIRKILKKFKD